MVEDVCSVPGVTDLTCAWAAAGTVAVTKKIVLTERMEDRMPYLSVDRWCVLGASSATVWADPGAGLRAAAGEGHPWPVRPTDTGIVLGSNGRNLDAHHRDANRPSFAKARMLEPQRTRNSSWRLVARPSDPAASDAAN